MRIAMFSDCFLDLTGGIVTVMRAEKQALESRGHTVYVFSSSYPKSKEVRQKLAKENIFPVKSCRIFGRGAAPIARRPRVIERELERTHPEIKDFDVFYVHYEAGCSIAGLRLAKKYGIPSVQVMHGREDMGEENIIPLGFRTIVATALNIFHSWYLPHPVKVTKDHYLAPTVARAKMWTLMVNHANAADFVITPSEHFKKKLLLYGVTRPIEAIPHGLPDQLTEEKSTPKRYDAARPIEIIWHSRLSREKRLLPFLEALDILQNPPQKDRSQLQNTLGSLLPRRHKEPLFHLSVYGSGPDEILARNYAKLHRLNVTFYGGTDFEHIWQALRQADLDVLNSYNYDTFGMTLIEAAASGTPSLIADPDLAEILPAGTYVLTKSPAPTEIADAISTLIAHPERITKMSEVALAARSHFKISHKISKLEKLFHSLQGQH